MVLGPIEAARERGQAATVSSADVAARVTGREVHLVGGSDEGVELLLRLARPGDVVAGPLPGRLRQDRPPHPRGPAGSGRRRLARG